MVEFRHTISAAELNGGYLNLKDDSDLPYADKFQHIPRLTQIIIIDGLNRTTLAKKHGPTQIWGTLRNWFTANNISAGTRILVKFNPTEVRDNCPVLYLIPETAPLPTTTTQVNEEEAKAELNNEIPLSLEKQLEDFLAANLELIEKGLKLYVDEDRHKGRQYPTDIGTIDLLCRRSDESFLVVELKRGKVADIVVGQISRYVGWVKHEIAGEKSVSGLILSHKPDKSLEYAVLANPNLKLRYFRLKLELLSAHEM